MVREGSSRYMHGILRRGYFVSGNDKGSGSSSDNKPSGAGPTGSGSDPTTTAGALGLNDDADIYGMNDDKKPDPADADKADAADPDQIDVKFSDDKDVRKSLSEKIKEDPTLAEPVSAQTKKDMNVPEGAPVYNVGQQIQINGGTVNIGDLVNSSDVNETKEQLAKKNKMLTDSYEKLGMDPKEKTFSVNMGIKGIKVIGFLAISGFALFVGMKFSAGVLALCNIIEESFAGMMNNFTWANCTFFDDTAEECEDAEPSLAGFIFLAIVLYVIYAAFLKKKPAQQQPMMIPVPMMR